MNKNDSLTAALKFAPLLEKYFLTYLIAQKKSSPRTVSTYRDSFTLYLRFMASVYGIAPDRIEMNHFSVDHLSAFGTYLETSRNCSPSTINLRMSAIKSFLKYAAVEAPEYSGIIRNRLLSNNRKGNLTRSGVGQRITTITEKAAELSPSLNKKNVTPHTFRHSAAMNLLQAGVDISTIAIWLGHESIETTHKYMVADIEIKRKAMERLDETSNSSFNYKPSKSILAFLASL